MSARGAGAACLAILIATQTAHALKVEEFYRSAPMRLTSGHDNGCSYNIYVRGFARVRE
jgi:hypothetical protein